jgi:hypothetical protein
MSRGTSVPFGGSGSGGRPSLTPEGDGLGPGQEVGVHYPSLEGELRGAILPK